MSKITALVLKKPLKPLMMIWQFRSKTLNTATKMKRAML